MTLLLIKGAIATENDGLRLQKVGGQYGLRAVWTKELLGLRVTMWCVVSFDAHLCASWCSQAFAVHICLIKRSLSYKTFSLLKACVKKPPWLWANSRLSWGWWMNVDQLLGHAFGLGNDSNILCFKWGFYFGMHWSILLAVSGTVLFQSLNLRVTKKGHYQEEFR